MAGLALLPVTLLAWVLTGGLRAPTPPALYANLVGVVLIGLHAVLTRAEARGWILYRKKRGRYSGLGVTSEWSLREALQ